jgi:hypothetical protein
MRINQFSSFIINLFIVILFIFTDLNAFCQYYYIGQDPANIKWKLIRTQHFKVIFPVQNEVQAQNLANYLEKIYDKSTATLKTKPVNIPVIMHTRSALSNGYSIWAPKRMEFFTIPPQETYGQDWMKQLAIHEFRHVVQMNKLNQVGSRLLYYLFGEQAIASILGLYIPPWFMEGDAVCAETALSETGRGRLPSFEMELKAQTLEKKIYRYDKAVFGSYKDYLPDQYILGYHITAYARKKYDAMIWNNTIDFVARHPLGITSFSRGFKKYAGVNKATLYYNAMKELDSLWKIQQSTAKLTGKKYLSTTHKNYTTYHHPHYLNDSIVVAVKKSMDDITRFVAVERNGNEKIIFTPGFLFSETFSVVDSAIVWSEVVYDTRWDNCKYTSIKMYDLRTGKCKTILPKTYFFAPALSNDKKLIAAIENNPAGENKLVIIETKNGNILKKIAPTENVKLITPSWNADNSKIVVIAVSDLGKSLVVCNYANSSFTTLIPFSYEEISKPSFYNNYVVYNGAFTGTDNIFAIDTVTGQKYQLTSSEFGGENAVFSPSGQKFIYSDYSANGFRLCEVNAGTENWIRKDSFINSSLRLYESISGQESLIDLDNEKPDSVFSSEKFRKLNHLFNIHSWGPVSVDAESAELGPGLSFMSQNLLSTAFSSVGYKYNVGERTDTYYADITYKGFYPVIDMRMSYGDRASTYLNENNENTRFEWTESKINSGIYIPFNISRGKFYRLLQPEIKFSFIDIAHKSSTPVDFVRGTISTMEYGFQFYNQVKSVEKDMRPRWAQSLNCRYSNTPFSGLNLGEIYAVSGRFSFPGVFRHHSFRLSFGYQHKNSGAYSFSDLVVLPRGASTFRNSEMNTVFFDYKLPLAYPDVSIPNIIYIKRIKANLFYDYAKYINVGNNNVFQSSGIEATMDFHLFRFIAPIEAGCRITYSPMSKHYLAEVLYQIKFDNL